MYALSCACKLITRRIVRTYIYYIIPVSGSRFLVQLAGPTLSLLFGGHCRSRTLRALTSLSLQSNFSIPAPVLQAPSSNIKYNALVPRFFALPWPCTPLPLPSCPWENSFGKFARHTHTTLSRGSREIPDFPGQGELLTTDNPFSPAAFYVHFKRTERSKVLRFTMCFQQLVRDFSLSSAVGSLDLFLFFFFGSVGSQAFGR